MIEFEPWFYRRIDGRLQLQGHPIDQPDEWASSVRAIEETIETLLALNLTAITGMPLTFVRRAWALDPSVDLVALDPANRIHIFELKKASVGAQEASQIEQYLLGHVFGEPVEFLEASRGDGRKQADQVRMARYLTGAFANGRSSIVGIAKIIRELGLDHPAATDSSGKPLTKYRWAKLPPEEQALRIHAALVRHAARKGIGAIPNFDNITSLASERSAELTKELSKDAGRCVPYPRLVIWLVGSSIQPSALERVRMWRRSGIDARVLRTAARHIDGRWVLATRRERSPQRDHLEKLVWERVAERDPSSVRFSLYNTISASKGKQHGGELLDHPKAKISWPDGRAERLEA